MGGHSAASHKGCRGCNIHGEEKSIPQLQAQHGESVVLAALSAIDAVRQSGLEEDEIASPECGVSYGSTAGSTQEQVELIGRYILNSDLTGALASSYLKCMSHTCAGNLSTLFRLQDLSSLLVLPVFPGHKA